MKYACNVMRGGREGEETPFAKQIDTVNAKEIPFWFAGEKPQLRISGASITFTHVGISIRGQESTSLGWETAHVRIFGMVP